MTSKERVLTAINHQEPDRVPVNNVGLNGDIDRRLKEHFGLPIDDTNGLFKALNVDFRNLELAYTGPKIHEDVPDRNVDTLWGVRTRWVEHESGGYWDYCDFPLKDATVEEVENWPMPSPDDFDYDSIAPQCEKYRDYCIVYGHPGMADMMNMTGMMRSMEQVYMDLAVEDEAWLRLIDRKNVAQLGIISRVLQAAAGKVDLLWIGEDLGTQIGPIMSKQMYRKTIRPRQQEFVDLAGHYDVPVMIHCCGSSSWAFDDFIEIGIKIVDTLQPEAKDMSPAYLKKTYGDKLSFHGCISTAGPMAYGTVKDTMNYVKETLEIMKPGGGYVMAPTHMIQDNTPTENVIAAYEATLKFGVY